MSKQIPVIIDCDPGLDDAIALFMALKSPELKVLAVTTVSGNVDADKTSSNALKIVEFAGADVPVAKGALKPLLRPARNAGEFHGPTGLGSLVLPEPEKKLAKENSVELMNRLISESSEKITLVFTGPLTNAALLLSTFPKVKENIERIVLMGGGLHHGNTTACAEFNVFADPEAAEIVFDCGLPVVMCGLDVTEQAVVDFDRIKEFGSIGGKVGKAVEEILNFYKITRSRNGYHDIAMHDPSTIVYLLHPEIFKTEDLFVRVETQGKYTAGLTFADRRVFAKDKPNAKVCLGVDLEKFIAVMKDCLSKY